ncbi:MAG: FAD-dependent oxidoreductase [Actinomycetota bacterium]|nr:FAD-dependent oxidoreductase [Actinomycetota bacterium]MDQ3732788.1 FAD-dependent oxidoreductase [Actinomycetota bacterium]
MTSYDLVVLGAGAAGLGAADGARASGKSVALLEADKPGGECTYTGCIPSKTLIESARRVREARNGAAYGFRSVVEVDFAAVMARVRAVVADVAQDESPDHLRRRGIDLWPGRARLLGEGEIQVGRSTVRADRVILATGAKPTIPTIAGLADIDHLTTESLFELTELPPRLVVLGGGITGCELAQAYARLGSTVILVESEQRVLPDEEPEVSTVISHALEASGVRLVLGRTVIRISAGPTLLLNDDTVVSGSHLLLAVGRTPRTQHLGLDTVGAEVDEAGNVKVDEHLSTTAEGVFAVGDCASTLKFTHVAYEQGRLAAHNAFAPANRPALLGGRREWDSSAIPRVTFTDPEVAHVGLTEAQAFAAYGEAAQVTYVSDRTSDRARCAGRTEGFVKMIAVPPKLLRSKLLVKLVGMSVVGPVAGELITQGTLAMRAGVLVGRIAQSVHAYPTWSMSVRICAAQFFGAYGGQTARPARGPQ